MDDFCMDAHMHFDLYKNREDILSYIEKHRSYTIAVTNLPELYERYHHKYGNFKFIKIALGFHPELVYKYSQQLPLFLKYIDTTRYIGEIGLDFTVRDKDNRKKQKEIFSEIINACQNKIISVHSRRAETECLDVLRDFSGKVILHWYSGNIRLLKEAVDMGCFFSVNQQMLLSQNGRGIVDNIPLDRILVESDAPFSKGLENGYSLFFYEKIRNYLSETRNLSQREISQIIKSNFRLVLS